MTSSLIPALLANLAQLKELVPPSASYLSSSLSSQNANTNAPMIIHSKTHRNELKQEIDVFQKMKVEGLTRADSEGFIADEDLSQKTDVLTARLLKKRKVGEVVGDADDLLGVASALSSINRAKKRRKVDEEDENMDEESNDYDDMDLGDDSYDVDENLLEDASEDEDAEQDNGASLNERLAARIIRLPSLSKKVEERDIRKALERIIEENPALPADALQSIHILTESKPLSQKQKKALKKKKKGSATNHEMLHHGMIVLSTAEARESVLEKKILFVRTAQCVMRAGSDEDAQWCLSNVTNLQL